MKNAQTGLKSCIPPADRADYLQTGTNPELVECCVQSLRSLLRNNAHARQMAVKNNSDRQWNKSKDM